MKVVVVLLAILCTVSVSGKSYGETCDDASNTCEDPTTVCISYNGQARRCLCGVHHYRTEVGNPKTCNPLNELLVADPAYSDTNASITWSWAANTHDVTYNVTCSNCNDGPFITKANTVTFDGLTPGTNYIFTFESQLTPKESSYYDKKIISRNLHAFTMPSKPAPLDESMSSLQSAPFTLHFNDPHPSTPHLQTTLHVFNNGNPVDSYTQPSHLLNIPAPYLVLGETYTYEVRAINGPAISAITKGTFSTPLTEASSPVVGLKVLQKNVDEAVVEWKPPVNVNGEITHFVVQVSEGSECRVSYDLRCSDCSASQTALPGCHRQEGPTFVTSQVKDKSFMFRQTVTPSPYPPQRSKNYTVHVFAVNRAGSRPAHVSLYMDKDAQDKTPVITQPSDDDDNGPLLAGIIGAVVVVILILVLLILFLVYKRRKDHKNTDSDNAGARNYQSHMMPLQTGTLDQGTSKHLTSPCRPIKVKEFSHKVKSLQQDSNLGFEKEFQELKALIAANPSLSKGKSDNEYYLRPASEPLPQTVVDNLNAKFIKGYKSDHDYVICSCPKSDHHVHFWQMVWHLKSPVIVMLSPRADDDKTIYWPPKLNENTNYNGLLVKMESSSTEEGYVVRKFSLTMRNSSTTVTHIQVSDWFQGQRSLGDTIKLLRVFRSEVGPGQDTVPIIHGSHTMGSVGSFVAMDYFSQHVTVSHHPDDVIDVFKHVLEISKSQPRLFNENQYVLIHEVIQAYLSIVKSDDDGNYDYLNDGYVNEQEVDVQLYEQPV